MPTRSNCVAAAAGALAGAAALSLLGFGPLDPPDGPIAPTYKTLTEVEPRTAINADNTPGDADSTYRITQPGAYYLQASYFAVSGKSGIEVAAANVTIDLNGFRVGGQAGSLSGIAIIGVAGVTIRDGTIYNMGGDGIDGPSATDGRVEGVTIRDCDGQGMIAGDGWEVTRCTALSNGSHGINLGDDCVVTGCIARGNTGVGIDVDDNSVVTGCVAGQNGDAGFGANFGSTLASCTAAGNAAEGFFAHDFCILRDCIAQDNTGAGFALFQQPNATRCTARSNTGWGFDLTFGGTIEGCNSSFNDAGGIRVLGQNGSNAASLLDNTCSSNGGVGILVQSASATRIEDNQCSYNDDWGIHVASAGNLAIHNSCRGNNGSFDPNYNFTNGADYGFVLDNPGSGFTSTAAWANFAY